MKYQEEHGVTLNGEWHGNTLITSGAWCRTERNEVEQQGVTRGSVTNCRAKDWDVDLAEHEAEELGQPPGLREDSPHLLPCLQPLTQPVVPPLCRHHTQARQQQEIGKHLQALLSSEDTPLGTDQLLILLQVCSRHEPSNCTAGGVLLQCHTFNTATSDQTEHCGNTGLVNKAKQVSDNNSEKFSS